MWKINTLQLIAGLDQDYEGKILFNQVKIEDIKDYRQLVISFVYQNYQLMLVSLQSLNTFHHNYLHFEVPLYF